LRAVGGQDGVFAAGVVHYFEHFGDGESPAGAAAHGGEVAGVPAGLIAVRKAVGQCPAGCGSETCVGYACGVEHLGLHIVAIGTDGDHIPDLVVEDAEVGVFVDVAVDDGDEDAAEAEVHVFVVVAAHAGNAGCHAGFHGVEAGGGAACTEAGAVLEEVAEADLADVVAFGPVVGQVVDDFGVHGDAFFIEQLEHGDAGDELADAGDVHAAV